MVFSLSVPLIGLAISSSVTFGMGASFGDIKVLENKRALASGVGIVHICLFAVAYICDLIAYPIVGDIFRVLGIIASVMTISCVCQIGAIQRVFLFYSSKVLKQIKK